MKKAKKLLALFLAVMMLFSGMSVGLGGIAVFAATNVTVDGVVDKTYTSTDDVIICVPETIYMTPSIGASVSGQYFVNNNVDENGKVTLATDRAHTTGQISFYAPGATAFSFNVTAVNGGIGDPVMGGSATDATASFETTRWQNTDLDGKTGYLSVDALNLFINGNGLTAGNTALIKWAITLYYGANDTTGVTYYAYSTLYSPYYYPIGAATRAKTNSKAYAQSIAWVSGVHGFTPNADDSKYWVAVTNETLGNENQDVTERGTYYVRTSGQAMVPLIYGVGDPGNTKTGVAGWLSSSAPGGGITVPTIRYFSLDNKSTNGGVMVVDISPVANLTVDTSRYNNLNQIPNFTVGYNVTDTDGADKVYWYVSDYTSVAHSVTAANNGTTNFYNWTKSTGKDDIDDYEPQWFNGTSAGSIIYGSATQEGTPYSSGVEWNTAWNRPLVTGSDHYDYMFKGAQHTYNGNRAYSINYVQLRVNNVDKSDLRSLVLKATSLNEQIYTTETWTPFIAALQTAAQALGNPTATAAEVSSAKTNLESAMNALKLNEYDLVFDNLIDFNQWDTTTASNLQGTINNRTDVGFTLTSNDGAGEATSLSPFFPVTPGKQYKIDIDITGAAWDVYIFFCDEDGNWVDFVDGPNGRYSSPAFGGMHEDHVFTAPNKAEVVKAQIRVDANGSNNSVTFKNIRVSEVGTVADGVSYVAPKTVTHGSTCSSLPTPTRPGYDFAGWAYANGTPVTASDKITANTNLYSTWTPATYTITFLDANGATHATDTYTLANTTITLPATNPTKTAYSFAGWEVANADGNWTSGETVTAAVASKYGNITVKPVWTPSNYDITFNTDGGSAVGNVSYNIESTFTLPTTTKTAYDFAGWKVQTVDGNWSADTTYQAGSQSGKYGNVTLVAQWNPTAYTITYDANGGNAIDAVGYTIKDTVALPTPVKTGYTFAGWKVTSGTAGSWTAGTYNAGNVSSMYGDVTLQAQWTAIPYTITFVNWDDSVLQDTKFDYGTTPVAPADPTRNADNGYTYTFNGWEPTVSTVTGEATYKATYTATLIPYTITLEAGEGGSVSSSSVAYNYESTSVTLPEPTRLGYTFTGWTVKETAGSWTEGAAVNGTLSNAWGNVTLVANYTPNEYTVTYNANNGTIKDENNTSFKATYDSEIGDLLGSSDVDRAGYTFAGWNTQADGSGETIETGKVWTYTDVTTVYAQWTPAEYTLTLYNYNKETAQYEEGVKSTMTYTIETNLQLPRPERTGYDFDRWATGISVKGSWTKETNYTDCNMGTGNYGDATLTLYYTPKTYTIKWYNGSTLLETDENVPYDSMPSYDGETPTQTPTETYAYEFTGWTPEVSAVTKDETYIATFKQVDRTYTVKFVDWDGTEISTQSLTYGATPTTPDDPTREQDAQYTYTFSTWKDSAGNTYNEILPVTADVTYIADYTATLRSYTITWNDDAGNKINTTTVEYGTKPTHADPIKTETAEHTYKFAGWEDEDKIVHEPNSELPAVTGVATYTATFIAVPREYTITWVNGQTREPVQTDTVAFGDTIKDIPAVPTHTDGLPGAWDNIPATMPAEDITITSVYVEGSVVTWVVGDTRYQKVFEKGMQIAYDKAEPTQTATAEYTYKFAGWAETENGDVITLPKAGTTPVTYYAVFTATPIEYTVTWMADGVEKYTEKVAYGELIPSKEVPDKTGHTGEWKIGQTDAWESVPATMPAEDVTITAVYTPIDYTITWLDDAGNEIDTTTVAYGDTPTHADPTKASIAQYDYTFAGWKTKDNVVYAPNSELPAVTGDKSYTATYTEKVRSYTITWLDDAGNLINTTTVEYGQTPTHADPTKASTAQYDYTFTGWTPEVVAVTGTATYTAKFDEKVRSYTITWLDDAGNQIDTTTVEYGQTPTHADPTKASTAQYSYAFAGWTPEVVAVTGTATYTAKFDAKEQEYTVTYIANGSTVATKTLAYGSSFVDYNHPAIPEKEGHSSYWNLNGMTTMPATNVTIEAVYTAKKYTVTWVADGQNVYEEQVAFGSAIPAKTVPAKPGNSGVWTNVPATMPAENVTITAEYSPEKYNVTWTFTTSSGSDIATYNETWSTTFTGYIPLDIRITVNGNLLSTDSYSYNADTGYLQIKGDAIIGNISITEKAVEGYMYVVISAVNATHTNNVSIVKEGEAFHTQLVPNEGYLLPEEIVVCINGVELNNGYSYDANTGRLTINADKMYGELSIRFESPVDPLYNGSSSAKCTCGCHSSSAFVRFFWSIINFLRKLFGMKQYQYCDCGTAHW